MKKIALYETVDGKTFLSEAEAALHERRLAIAKEVERFIESRPTAEGEGDGVPTARTVSRIRNVIVEWEVWRAEQERPPMKPVPVKAAD